MRNKDFTRSIYASQSMWAVNQKGNNMETVKFNIENINQLKKLIREAEDQTNELKRTLEKIENFQPKIRVL